MSNGSPDYNIAVVARTLDLLEALAEIDAPVGATELARQIGSTKSAVYRILATLEQRGYVIKDPATSCYQLGARLAYLGGRSLRGIDLRQIARPVLERLQRDYRETVNLAVLDSTDIVYVDMIESDYGLRMAAQLGSRDPAYATSLGKAMLAFMTPEERTLHLPPHLVARTARTITDAAVLANELDRIRESGYAEDLGENEDGSHCLGAPIFNHTGSVIAAISVSGPESRIDSRMAAEIAAAVKDAAREITGKIGGFAPRPTNRTGTKGLADAPDRGRDHARDAHLLGGTDDR